MRRKTFFYLFALLCSMSFCVACSDDDDEKVNIPSTPIESADLSVTVNGVAGAGTAQFEVKNASEAVLTLNNVIPGYATVPVDVELEAQSDGSYKFAGEAALTTPPAAVVVTRMDNVPTIMTVAVAGTVTPAGKATVNASTELSEGAQGGLANTWKVQDYIHGNVDDWGNISYFFSSPLFVKWSAKNAEEPNLELLANLATALGSSMVFPMLNEVSLNADGNITAKYWESEEMIMAEQGDAIEQADGTMIVPFVGVEHSWLTSPKNMAFWYTSGGLFYVVPNVTAIMNEAGEGEAGTGDLTEIVNSLTEYGINVEQLLPLVMEWMKTGVPLKYKQEGTTLKLYVDKEMAAPFMEILLPALKKVDEKMDAILAMEDQINAMPEGDEKTEMLETLQTVQMVKTILPFMLGIENLAAIETIWKQNTQEFEIALCFDNTLHSVASSHSLAPVKAADDRMEQMNKFFPALKQLMKR